MITTVIFDMNGVIIDDERIHELIFQDSVLPYGIKISHEEYLECCAGRTDREGYESIGRKFGQDLPVDELLQVKHAMYREQFPKYKQAYPGVLELIEHLAESYQLALVSSAARSEIDLITSEFGINRYFAFTISAEDVQRGKPDPEPYRKAVDWFQASPNECVVIEDSVNGIRSAKSAGCFCVAVTNTHAREELVQADLIVDSFAEITDELLQSFGK